MGAIQFQYVSDDKFLFKRRHRSFAVYGPFVCSSDMASHLKIILLTCLLSFIILMEEIKPVLAKGGERLKQRTKMLEESFKELKKVVEEQKEKIKTLEECTGKLVP